MSTAIGTPAYMAPEILVEEARYGPAVDVWSMGVILYVILCGYPPFDDSDLGVLKSKIKKGIFSFLPEDWNEISEEAKSLVTKMLTVDPKMRIQIEEIQHHPWVSE